MSKINIKILKTDIQIKRLSIIPEILIDIEVEF